MEILLMVVSVLLIALGLLQSGKAEGAGNVLQGGNSDLFTNRKERGGELLISRITFGLGMAFFLISFLMSTNIFR